MKTITSVKEMKRWSRQVHCEDKVIGFVPTMGCLHEGHLSLVKASISKCDYTVVSIFVNPTQFGPCEDLESYPRNIESDKEVLQSTGTDVLFYPSQNDLYPENFQTFVEVEEKTKYLCGKSRPEFFRGVTTIVLKLFNILNPHKAFFGEKDLQQLMVIRRMVDDLCIPIEIVGKPIIREDDGLAMSSRNSYLSATERAIAPIIHQTLKMARANTKDPSADFRKIEETCFAHLQNSGFKPEYFSIRRSNDLLEANRNDRELSILAAAWLGNARLIDNVQVSLDE